MMCSAQVKANTLMVHGFVWVSTDVDNDLHLAEVRLVKAEYGYNLYIGCPTLGTAYNTCYWQPDFEPIEDKFIEICIDHNIALPNDPKLYYDSVSIIDYYNLNV